MCLIAWNWQPDRSTPLLLLANRDEFYARPALPLHWWGPSPNGTEVLAGKDLQGGGTWLGVSRSGRLAALTNYRSTQPLRTDTPSRGELVAAFLHGDQDAPTYLEQLAQHCGDYNPFNLLVFDGHQLMGLESRNARVLRKPAGVGGVSNADFQTPWPLTRLKAACRARRPCKPMPAVCCPCCTTAPSRPMPHCPTPALLRSWSACCRPPSSPQLHMAPGPVAWWLFTRPMLNSSSKAMAPRV
jgi:hypothetical protein